MQSEDRQQLMILLVEHYLCQFMTALKLSARRGGFKADMPDMVARLNTWLHCEDLDYHKWFNLTQEAGQLWMDWYDWYSRIYNRPNAVLGGLSIDEWREDLA